MTTSALVSAVPFGERTDLLPKQMRYALALEFSATATGLYLVVAGTPKNATPPFPSALRHLFDEKIVTMPEGVRCDVPTCRLLSGNGQIGTASDPKSSNFSVDMSVELDDGMPMNLTCGGVVLFRGGPGALWSASEAVSGSAFVATSYETASATYRWLTRRELFGVGVVEGKRSLTEDQANRRLSKEEKAHLLSGKPWELWFSFDLYGAF